MVLRAEHVSVDGIQPTQTGCGIGLIASDPDSAGIDAEGSFECIPQDGGPSLIRLLQKPYKSKPSENI